jgi:hypothetical protein
MFSAIPLSYYSKFPGLFSHPLTDKPGVFCGCSSSESVAPCCQLRRGGDTAPYPDCEKSGLGGTSYTRNRGRSALSDPAPGARPIRSGIISHVPDQSADEALPVNAYPGCRIQFSFPPPLDMPLAAWLNSESKCGRTRDFDSGGGSFLQRGSPPPPPWRPLPGSFSVKSAQPENLGTFARSRGINLCSGRTIGM